MGEIEFDTTVLGARAWVVDGQHRLGAFIETRSSELQTLPLPVIFIAGLDRVKEANLFYVVNSKQKNVSPSLKYYDLMKFGDEDLRGWLEGSDGQWRVRASVIATALDAAADSPWRGRINLTGARGTHKPVNLVSFITALRPVLEDRWFGDLPEERQLELLMNFWRSTALLWPAAWDSDAGRHCLLQKSLGVIAMSMAALDVFHHCRKLSDFSVPRMQRFMLVLLDHVQGWRADSRIGTYGGMKGYRALGAELRQIIRAGALAELEAARVADDA